MNDGVALIKSMGLNYRVEAQLRIRDSTFEYPTTSPSYEDMKGSTRIWITNIQSIKTQNMHKRKRKMHKHIVT